MTWAAVQEVWVPGSFELPLIAKAMAASGKYDAVLAIGAVVRASFALACSRFQLALHAEALPSSCRGQ